MRRRFVLFLAILLCCIMILSSCSNPLSSLRDFFNKENAAQQAEEPKPEIQSLSEVSAKQPEDTRPTVMYYKDNEGLLVPVMRYIPKGDMGLAKSAINALIYNTESADDLKNIGLGPVLPLGTKILGAVIKESGLATIDLSKEFANFSNEKAEELGVKALVYTLTEFENIKSVQIKIEGKILEKLPYGTKIGVPLKRSEINLQSNEKSSDKLSKVMVYYQKKGNSNYSYFVPVTKLVSGSNSAEASVKALLEGPPEQNSLTSPFPQGTQLLGVEVKDSIAYVNFSEEILNTAGDKSKERAMIKAVTLTLGQFSQISKVKLFVNGKTIDNTEGIGANEYLDVPIFVNFYD